MTVLTGEGAGVIVSLRQRRINLGRGDNADIRLQGETISRNHAQLTLDRDGHLKLVDIGSRNGTFVNGVTVSSEVLRDGDRVAFGGDVVVDIRYGEEPGGEGDSFLPSLHVGQPATSRFDHSVASYARALDLREKRLGSTHPSVAVVLNTLGMLHLAEGRTGEAVTCHEQAFDIQSTAAFVTELERAQTKVRLANALLGRDEFERAQQCIDEADELFRGATIQSGELLEYWLAVARLRHLTAPALAPMALDKAKAEVSALRTGSPFQSAKHTHLTAELDRLAIQSPPQQASI